jgi:hypothetical protein
VNEKEFDANLVTKVLGEMAYSPDAGAEILLPLLEDQAKVDQLIKGVQGPNALLSDPARLKKRAERILREHLGQEIPSSLKETAPAKKPKKETTVSKTTSKKAPAKKAAAKAKEPGVIDTIVKILQSGGGTVEQIAAKLKKAFPDRKADGLKATVKIQMTRLADDKKRKLKIKREKVEGTNELSYSA